MNAVLQQLEELIISDDWVNSDCSPEQQSIHFKSFSDRPKLNELGRTTVTSASLKAYIGLLGTHHKQSIAAWLYGSTTQAICDQFKFSSGSLRCFDCGYSSVHSTKNGIGAAIRLALRDIYGPEYINRGWRAFAEIGAPVVYVSPALRFDVASYLSSEFGISDVVILPKLSSDYSDVEGRIDYKAFEQRIKSDIEQGNKPLMVVGVVGSTVLGQNDVISRLLEIRKQNRFWLHIVGQGIAALLLKEPSEVMIQVLSQVDSMSFSLSQWLGVPAAPGIIIHRNVENQKLNFKEKLDILPWWIATQYLTPKMVTDIIENAYYLSKIMLKGLSSFPQIQIMGIDNPVDFANKVYKGKIMPPTSLVFNYRHVNLQLEKEEADEYVRALNCWLWQGLLHTCRPIGLQIIELGENYGVAFRYCPLETAALNATSVGHIQDFIKRLSSTIRIIESTAAARKEFASIAAQYPSLLVMYVKKWAGVGAVCYVPAIVKETNPAEWYEQQRQQVSQLNIELVHSLRSVDSAFSLGESSKYGVACVKFGMLSDEKDLENLLKLVSERGQEIEKSQQYMDSLAEMIRQGIEAANEDLKKENDARLMQEGVVRQIPLMGSIFNWLSPLDKSTQTLKGRSFDLKTGQIQTTEIFYKNRLAKATEKSEESSKQTVTVNGDSPSDETTAENTEEVAEEVKAES
uniref:Pyridoxal-dependent decarboxylase domain-containing protein 1 n=1 Tax=Syphacia muris TaxID=451379 RepID=A0A0N5AKQ0_9BILA